jgi:hypothetical protein
VGKGDWVREEDILFTGVMALMVLGIVVLCVLAVVF